ncbi:MAG: hypothetical protein ACTSSN_05450 [Candidatus Heimdallarchaeaceae archaeon]
MKKKKTVITLGAFCVLIFVLLPVAAANDYVTYGAVKSSFNAMLNGGSTLEYNAEFDIEREILPAILDGRYNGRITPWLDGLTYRYEDAHGIYGAIYVSEIGLQIAQYLAYAMFGLVFTYDTINEGCFEYLSWFTVKTYLNGIELEMTYTPIKRSVFFIGAYGDEALWWFNVGALFKPGELEPGTYHLVTEYYMNPLGLLPEPITNPFTPTDDICFTIV